LVQSKKSTIHLIGLIQEEGVHSVTRHCISLLKMIKDNDFTNVNIHAITDGRDTPPQSAIEHLKSLQDGIDKVGIGKIVSLTGRYYTMDRDTNWDRTEIGYRAIMEGVGKNIDNWKDGIEDAYANDETDEFIKPRIINYNGVGKDDVIIFFNFRFDRTRQITKAIVEKNFSEFKTISHNISYIAMTHYYDNGNFKEAFPELKYKNIFGEVLADNGLNQLRCAETEKYATGVYPAIIKAVEVVDKCVGEIVEKMNEKGGVSILTADHGNADKTTLDDGSPMTAHTKNPVPITIINNGKFKLREGGSLCDIIPTILEIMNIEQPVEMTGVSLIKGK